MVIQKVHSVGVVAKDMIDYRNWVAKRTYNPDMKYFYILNAKHAKRKYDEIVYTTLSSINPNYFEIYNVLNGECGRSSKFRARAV